MQESGKTRRCRQTAPTLRALKVAALTYKVSGGQRAQAPCQNLATSEERAPSASYSEVKEWFRWLLCVSPLPAGL